MGTAKRERQKAGRQARLEQAKVAQARKQRFRLVRNLLILGVVVFGGLFLYVQLTDDDDDVTPAEEVEASGSTTTSVPEVPTITVPPPGAAVTGETPCPPADGSAERTTSFEQPPPMCIDTAKTYTAEVVTSEGAFTITLADDSAPQTVNNFVVLARYHFYDGVPFHRIVTGFMNQTGDAVGSPPGTGRPGYTIPDELTPENTTYVPGTVAMANTGQPNSGGSQWFVIVPGGELRLQPDYTGFGNVTAGMDVVERINTFGVPTGDGTPTGEVVIQSVTITES